MPVTPRLTAGLLGLASAALAAGTASADDYVCTVPDPGTAKECGALETFEPDALGRFGPNQPFHATLSLLGASSFATKGGVTMHPAIGPEFLFGISFFDSQRLRFSIGADALFGEWAGPLNGPTSIEPKMRIDLRIIDRGVGNVGIFGESTVPYFPRPDAFGGGFGGGVTAGVFNRISIDVAYAWFTLPTAFAPGSASTTGGRLELAAGGDFVTFFGGPGIPPTTQIQIDLRCVVLKTAFQHAGEARCDAVKKARDEIPLDTTEPEATQKFIAKLDPALRDALQPKDESSRQCVAKQRRFQRACLDCTKNNLLRWPSYEIDVRQLVAALGCSEEPAAAMICEDTETGTAAEYLEKKKCP